MLSNHLQNGIETARLVWSRLPNSDDEAPDEVGLSKKSDGSRSESLDYEVIENNAYREEQVRFSWFLSSIRGDFDSTIFFLWLWFLFVICYLRSVGAEKKVDGWILCGREVVLCPPYWYR